MNELYHWGIKGQKHGLIRFPNYDGSLTTSDRIRYCVGQSLAHHGVKGMHWHHRRWQNHDGSLTPEGYIHYGIKPSKKDNLITKAKRGRRYTFAKAEYNDPYYVAKTGPLTDADKKKYGVTSYINNGGELQKGTKLYRTTDSKDKHVKGAERKYFSTSRYDADKWVREFVPQIEDPSEDTYELSKTIKIASAVQLGEEWSKLWLEKNSGKTLSSTTMHPDSPRSKALKTDFTRDNYDIVTEGYGFNEYKKEYDPFAAGSKFTQEKLRDLAASNLMMTDVNVAKELISRLKSKGYGGVADLNGIDVSYDPVIVFDPDKSSKIVSSKNFAKEEINALERLYRANGSFDKKYSEIRKADRNDRFVQRQFAKTFKSQGYTVEEIAKAMGLTLGQVDGLLYGSW